jgi:hypothetical protein
MLCYNSKHTLVYIKLKIMSRTDVYVPDTRPTTPTKIKNTSFQSTYLNFPNSSGQSTHSSIIAGKANPNALKQRAPNREMNNPNRGIPAAKITIFFG